MEIIHNEIPREVKKANLKIYSMSYGTKSTALLICVNRLQRGRGYLKKQKLKFFPTWWILKNQIQEAQWTTSPRNMKKSIPRYSIIKLLKISNKEKILKATREKRHVLGRTKINMTADFLSEKTQEERKQSNVLKTLKPPYPPPTHHDPR